LIVNIYTDGAASGNPGPGGYGVVMEAKGLRKEFSGGFRRTTNNRMELLATIVGMEALKRVNLDLHIYSDSKYVVDAVNKGWVFNWVKKGFKDKKNPDLWRKFLELYKIHQPKLHWIKGHNNHPQNERCDALAVAAYKNVQLMVDKGFEAAEKSAGLL
jgi:ribonuclease HI